MLNISNLTVSYGEIRALMDVDINVTEGEIVTVIGANGAGKTTLVRTISGLVSANSGSIEFNGVSLTELSPDQIVHKGVVHVPEGREIFPKLTVLENLKLGAYARSDADAIQRDREWVYELFPRLEERKSQLGQSLSGGEQQMLAIGRGLMSNPDFLILDEPSLGLAPQIIGDIERIIAELNERGLTILLIEQNADMAMRLANRAYVLQNGEVRMHGDAEELSENEEVRATYLGM